MLTSTRKTTKLFHTNTSIQVIWYTMHSVLASIVVLKSVTRKSTDDLILFFLRQLYLSTVICDELGQLAEVSSSIS